MNLYQLEWVDWEESWHSLFSHEENKTQEEFDADAKSVIVNNIDEYLENEKSWAGSWGFMKFVSNKMLELGYIKPEVISSQYPSGGQILKAEDDPYGFGDDDEMWRDFLGEESFKKLTDHNQKIENELRKK